MAEDDESHVDSHGSLSSSVINNDLNVSSNHDENITIEDDKINNVSIIIASDRNSFVRRYGTYDLNRSKDVDSTATFSDSAQAANFSSSSLINHSPSKLTFQQHQTSVNKNSSSISKKSESSTKILSPINTSNFDNTITTNLDDIPQSLYGGIKVTTVVEVLNSPIKNEFENEVASSTTPKVNQFRTSTSSTKSKKRNSRPENIYTSVNDLLVSNGERKRGNISPPPPKPSTPSPPPPLPQSRSKQHIEFVSTKSNVKPNLYLQKQSPKKKFMYSNNAMVDDSKSQQKLKKNASMAPVKSLKIGNKRKGILDKQKEIIIPKEMAFIDPKLLTHGNLVRIPSNRRLKRINSNIHRKKIPKNMEYAPTSNPIHSNDPTDIDADLPQKNSAYPWLPEISKPPQLLHASLVPLPHCSTNSSLISTVNNTSMTTNTSTEENNKNNISSSDNNNTNCNSKMLTIDQKHNSKISTSNFLSRKNSLRKRTSLIQSSNRASLIFRRQLLEESIMMSFGGYNYMLSNNNNNNNNNNANINIKQPSSLQKLPIRKKTKKGSNAKVEDRETRRERRRKEKEAKGLLNYTSNINNIGSINYDSINLTKEEYHHNKKEQIFMGPQPPPRKSPADNVMNGTRDYFQKLQPQQPKQPKQKLNNTISLLLLSSPIDRRNFNNSNDNDYNNNFIIGNGNHDKDMIMSTIEPTFPTHLLSSTPYSDNHSSTNKKLKFPHTLPLGSLPTTSKTNQQQSLGKEEFDDELYSNNNKILPSTANKPQKININILGGLFNKQNPKETSANQQQLLQNHHHQSVSTSITSTQLPLSPLSPTTPLPTKSHFISQKTSPPQSPPLSPSKSSRLPTQLPRVGKQRHMNDSSNSKKIRKREQQSEAGTDTTHIISNNTANRLVGKIKILKIDNGNNNSNALSSTTSSFSNSNDFNSLMNNNHERKTLIDMKVPPTYIHKGHSCQDSYNGIIFGNRESINNNSDNYDRNSVDSADKISLVDRICSLQT